MILRVALPQLDGFVVFKGSRGDDIFGWMAGSAQDSVSVSLQTLNDLLRLKIPDVHHVVFTARYNPLEKRFFNEKCQ